VDDEIVKLRDLENVSSIVVTHQLRDAFYIATHRAERQNGNVRMVPAEMDKERETDFIMLKDGIVWFEGDAKSLRESQDEYLRLFLS
jgi:hypothetical protein